LQIEIVSEALSFFVIARTVDKGHNRSLTDGVMPLAYHIKFC